MILYSKLKQLISFRTFNIEAREPCDLLPVNLGPSSIDFGKKNGKEVYGSQRDLLQTHNVLRPKAATQSGNFSREILPLIT